MPLATQLDAACYTPCRDPASPRVTEYVTPSNPTTASCFMQCIFLSCAQRARGGGAWWNPEQRAYTAATHARVGGPFYLDATHWVRLAVLTAGAVQRPAAGIPEV
jgi:hypothetical protein